jgi:hypothetical protein
MDRTCSVAGARAMLTMVKENEVDGLAERTQQAMHHQLCCCAARWC